MCARNLTNASNKRRKTHRQHRSGPDRASSTLQRRPSMLLRRIGIGQATCLAPRRQRKLFASNAVIHLTARWERTTDLPGSRGMAHIGGYAMIRYLKSPFAIASLLTCAYLMGPVMTQAGESESVATIVAVHIRSQGFRCENPISAQHAPRSKRRLTAS